MIRTLFTLIIAAGILNIGFAQATYEITSSKLTIAGTSNLHDWESSATQVNASGDLILEGSTLKSIKALTVDIPVKGIKSEKGSIMDKKTWSALKSDSYSKITYKLTKATVSSNGEIKATGSLTIAGKTNTIDMDVKGKVLSDGSLQFEGSKKLSMTDYGIDPPTALMGTMKTGNDVTISFTVKMAPANGNGKTTGK